MTDGGAWPAKKLSWMGCNWTLKQEERRKIEGIGADLSMPIRYIPEGKYAKLVVQLERVVPVLYFFLNVN